jgi:hypothetical protein
MNSTLAMQNYFQARNLSKIKKTPEKSEVDSD